MSKKAFLTCILVDFNAKSSKWCVNDNYPPKFYKLKSLSYFLLRPNTNYKWTNLSFIFYQTIRLALILYLPLNRIQVLISVFILLFIKSVIINTRYATSVYCGAKSNLTQFSFSVLSINLARKMHSLTLVLVKKIFNEIF